ncbi:hypothetical protein NE237_011641 [Protea cynaroides]|uniref:X8 domain-containing protein n=1 Tax=Protea cynaroides TaxID=273540 RepID=A0A9Q0JYG7_9MAGN|nr:hypothetical protein NE237_011641 [Protea cynaroides]
MEGAAESKVALVLMMVLMMVMVGGGRVEAQRWCVTRSNANSQALQSALDYACGAGADCAPIQSTGLCYLPNTVVAHASYAFNSYYQRRGEAPGTCDFGGTATIAMTNPSYGSCVYPSSSSTAGGTTPTTPTIPKTPTTPTTPTMTPTTNTTGGTPLTPTFNRPPLNGLTPDSTVPSIGNNRAAFRPSITIVLPFSLSLSFFTYLFNHFASF